MNKYLSLFNYFFNIFLIFNFIYIYICCILSVIIINIQVSLFFFLILIHILYRNTGWWLLPRSGVGSFLSQNWVTTFRNNSRIQIIVIRTGYWFRFNYYLQCFISEYLARSCRFNHAPNFFRNYPK
jgi:hypothetical protein